MESDPREDRVSAPIVCNGIGGNFWRRVRRANKISRCHVSPEELAPAPTTPCLNVPLGRARSNVVSTGAVRTLASVITSSFAGSTAWLSGLALRRHRKRCDARHDRRHTSSDTKNHGLLPCTPGYAVYLSCRSWPASSGLSSVTELAGRVASSQRNRPSDLTQPRDITPYWPAERCSVECQFKMTDTSV